MSSNLFIDVNRSGYSPSQCGDTMTVQELINFLGNYEPDSLVYLKNDNGYTYGSINECDFSDEE